MIGILIVTVCYVGLNAVYLRVLAIAEVIASTRVAADAFGRLVGPAGGTRDFGAGDVQRVRRAERHHPRGSAGVLPDGAGRPAVRMGEPPCIHVFQTPGRAIVLQAVWSSVLVWTGTYRALFTRVIYTEWIFFALLGVGVVAAAAASRLSSQRGRMPLRAGRAARSSSLASAAIVVNQLAADPRRERHRSRPGRCRASGLLAVVANADGP